MPRRKFRPHWKSCVQKETQWQIYSVKVTELTNHQIGALRCPDFVIAVFIGYEKQKALPKQGSLREEEKKEEV
ncbi:MAG: hypothetical protein Kow0080_23660 [Candidatus Promineifilaceae bacterium]